MRPKTFPATTYSGNSRQRLQEIREGLKQPSKSSGQGLPLGPGSETSLDPKLLVGKDAARQQQMRQTPKFGPYQKALREIRYSLLPFANESGTPAAVEVNRQMLQELVNAGCDQVRTSLERGDWHSAQNKVILEAGERVFWVTECTDASGSRR